MKALVRKVEFLLLLLALPLAGASLARRHPLAQYLEFPPVSRYVVHATFSWPVFAAMAAGIALALLPFVRRMVQGQRQMPSTPGSADRPFPLWGWAGLALGMAAWILAWSRFEWFRPLQAYTFTPLWIGYIVAVNALTERRSGRCLLRERPVYMLKLAALSAAFWWSFEYLNRFVQNWFYLEVEDLGALGYFLLGTLPFSTVLPAVLSTEEWLQTYPRLTAGLDAFAPLRFRRPRPLAALGLLAGAGGLAALPVWPNAFFPFLWLAPLAMLTAIQILHREPTVFAGVDRGDWRRIVRLALAALVCGFFWEMWNWHSLCKWVYAVPYVNRFRIFEMPLLGFAGYVPFGLECAASAAFFLRTEGETDE
jgi:hypothetical protein